MNLITFLNSVSRLLNWLISLWFITVPNANQIGREFIVHINSLLNEHGWLYTIQRVKLYRLCVTRYMCGEPLKHVDLRIGLTKSGFPKKILPMKVLIDSGEAQNIRFVLTLLGVSRAIHYDENLPDYSTITKPSKIDKQTIESIGMYIPTFLEKFGIEKYEGKWNKMSAHLSTKSGPQGLSTWTAWKTAFLLPEDLIDDLEVFGGTELKKFILLIRNNRYKDYVFPVFKAFKFSKFEGLRKLSIVRDPEAKARIIAILDWFSQEALRPFHEYIFTVLPKIPQDKTFSQDPTILNKRKTESFHSLDLSAATDRFPIILQKMLVSHLTSENQAESWQRILTKLPYRNPEGNLISYEVGQPMGAYSSWAVFTLTHHLIVHYAAALEGIPSFTEYILLGDDIVIYNDRVKYRYIQIINLIGAEISEKKSHSSKEWYEFAKRWFKNGKEVTGIPVRGFLDNMNSYVNLYRNTLILYQRGYHAIVPTTVPGAVFMLLRSDPALFSKPKFLRNLENRLESLHVLHRYIHLEDRDSLRNYLNLRIVDSGWTLPFGEELDEFLLKLVRTSVDGILLDNTQRLETYTNDLISQIYLQFEGVASQTNGFMPSILDIGTLPIILGVFSKMKTTVERLVTPLEYTDLREVIKVCDFEDPKRITVARATVRLLGTESRIVKRMLKQLEFMASGQTAHHHIAGQRSSIALKQMSMISSLINPSNPFSPLRGVAVIDWNSVKEDQDTTTSSPLMKS